MRFTKDFESLFERHKVGTLDRMKERSELIGRLPGSSLYTELAYLGEARVGDKTYEAMGYQTSGLFDVDGNYIGGA